MTSITYKKIYEVVKQIPRGRVATYGQIADLAGIPGQARQVGYALSALKDAGVPWHRVINARGEISTRSDSAFESLQRILLEQEEIDFTEEGVIPLAIYRWRP